MTLIELYDADENLKKEKLKTKGKKKIGRSKNQSKEKNWSKVILTLNGFLLTSSYVSVVSSWNIKFGNCAVRTRVSHANPYYTCIYTYISHRYRKMKRKLQPVKSFIILSQLSLFAIRFVVIPIRWKFKWRNFSSVFL